MARALIGYTGYVGSTLSRQASFEVLFRASNISEIHGREFDMVVCAAARSKKWFANLNPDEDRRHIEELSAHLRRVTCGMFVLISTVDVFRVPVGVDELSVVDQTDLHAYGLHRRWLEEHVEREFPEHLIVRLPGLVGPGLRKNVLFDFLTDNNVTGIDGRAVYQFYPMVNLWPDCSVAIANDLRLIHLTAEPMSVTDVASAAFGRTLAPSEAGAAVRYDMRTAHGSVYGLDSVYQYTRRESLLAIRAYAQSGGATADLQVGHSRISVSNIAWESASDEAVAQILQRQGVDAIDVAHSRYFATLDARSPRRAERVRQWWEKRGVFVIGMQSLMFGTSGLNLFGADDVQARMLGHLGRVFDVARALGATRLTFGSPMSRDRTGLTDSEAISRAVDFFRRVGDLAGRHAALFCLEPNDIRYGSNFMLTSQSTADVVELTAHPNIRMQFDSGAVHLAGEEPGDVACRFAAVIGHVHASEPDLVPVGTGGVDHDATASAIHASLPAHIVTVEMAQVPGDRGLAQLEQSIEFAVHQYGGPHDDDRRRR